MRKAVSLLLLFCLLAVQAHINIATAVSDDNYDEAVEFIKDHGFAEGYSDGSFGENSYINRAEMVKIMMLAVMDEDEMHGSFCFRDVGVEWFAKYICMAKDHNMVRGYPDGMFHPERNVTFAEAASLIVHAYHGETSGGGSWYVPYVNQLSKWDAVPPSISMIHDPITRGEMAYIIWKAELEENGEEEEEEEEDADIEVSVRALDNQPAAGATVTYIITIENNDNTDLSIDASIRLDDGLELRESPGADSTDKRLVKWNNLSIPEDEEAGLIVIAAVGSTLAAGKTLTVTVEAEDKQASAVVTVKNTTTITPPPPPSPVGDPILHWNAILLQAVADDHSGTFGVPEHMGPGDGSRSLAIVHIAMYDAVVSIDRSYKPYIAYVPIQPGEKVSMDAAVAAAAYKSLVALHPKHKAVFDAAYVSHLSKIPNGSEKFVGILVGEASAQQILKTRESDGSVTDFTYVPSQLPGRHRVDPVNPTQPFLGPKWGNVKPFAVLSGSQFRAPPPPALTSKEYADAYNEVKLYGGDGITTPTIRTKDQTEIGLFWAYDGTNKLGVPPRLYNQIVRVIALQKGNTIVQNARLFALINIAQADAGIVCWESKYYYDYWRPVIGLREADQGTGPSGLGDNNPLTTGDANWTALGAPMSNNTANNFTPPFPAYPSGHATFGAATFRTVALFYGTDEIPFTFVSDELNGITTDNKGVVRPYSPRTYTRLSDATRDNAQSRIYLGIHWQFDATEGIKMGNSIAEYSYQNIMQPVAK